MSTHTLATLLGVAVLAVGCTTTGRFVIPEGTQLEVYERSVTVGPDGTVTTKPFFWTAAGVPPNGGIVYRLHKNGKTIKEGRLRAQFRVASIFWPPILHAVIYWPIGFNPRITYDLVNDTQE